MPQVVKLPEDPFAPYSPLDSAPWNVSRVNHLLRRIAFGPTSQRLDKLLSMSPGEAIDSLLDYDADVDPFDGMLEQMEGLINIRDVTQVQQWWIYRMIYSPNTAQERIALFWHNYFATSGSKVGNGRFLLGQIDLFRQRGLGSFRDLLIHVQRDPAMLLWLDGRDNRKGKPNENFSREVMELFTLGVGNYTENDVKELARCFTGWRIEDDHGVLRRDQFDDGEKRVFGKTGRFDAESAIDLLLSRPQAPRFLARRMLREFVYPEPTDEMIDHYSRRLLERDWNIKLVLREMLSSRLFFSDYCYRSKIKSPADLVIGSALALGGKPNMQFLREQMSKMGQNILYPPNVKGWDGEAAWINSNTVLVRFNYGMSIATGRRTSGPEVFARRNDLETPLKSMNVKRPEEIIDAYARVLLDSKLPDGVREKFVDYMNRDQKDQPKPFVFNRAMVESKVRDALHLMMSVPEYQLA